MKFSVHCVKIYFFNPGMNAIDQDYPLPLRFGFQPQRSTGETIMPMASLAKALSPEVLYIERQANSKGKNIQ